MIRRLFSVVLLSASLTACGTIDEKVDRKDQALEALNKQQYDEAISILKDLLKDRPDESDLKILLASAYCGSVGFDVLDSFSAFEPILFKKKEASLLDIDPPKGPEGEKQTQVKDLERQAVRFLDQFVTTLATAKNVPYLKLADRQKIVEALILLDGVKETEGPLFIKAKRYAALLNALQFLNYTRDSFSGGLADPEESVTLVTAVCALNGRDFLDNLEVSLSYLISSVDDLTASGNGDKPIPASYERLRDAAKRVQGVYSANKEAFSSSDLSFSAIKSSYCE